MKRTRSQSLIQPKAPAPDYKAIKPGAVKEDIKRARQTTGQTYGIKGACKVLDVMLRVAE